MEFVIFCITVGMLLAVVFVGVGVIVGRVERHYKKQYGVSDNSWLESNDGSRMGSGNNGHDMENERRK